MRGYDELAAKEARAVLDELLELELERRREGVLRLVEQVERVFADLVGEVFERRLAVRAGFEIAFRAVADKPRRALIDSALVFVPAIEIVEPAKAKQRRIVSYLKKHRGFFIPRSFSFPVHDLVEAASVVKLFENVVARNDLALIRYAVEFCAAKGAVIVEEISRFKARAPVKSECGGDQVEDRRFAAAVAAVDDRDRLEVERRRLGVFGEHFEGIERSIDFLQFRFLCGVGPDRIVPEQPVVFRVLARKGESMKINAHSMPRFTFEKYVIVSIPLQAPRKPRRLLFRGKEKPLCRTLNQENTSTRRCPSAYIEQ